jgi:hypothetical protein
MLLYGSSMGDGNAHSPHDLPVLLVGGGCGRLKGGRHLSVPIDTPFMNVGVSVLNKVDVHVDAVGDSAGPLSGL